ncbi:unnamed protein product [Urochloa decumbens]|uniref:Obtusifoliol 14-alpha demethylase n=1 Tax=Urochloa decumbens TaxID=240449 RepID=A0ABC9AJC4_9POAL
MDIIVSAVWFTIALATITVVIMTKVARRRTKVDTVCHRPPPPTVNGGAAIGVLYTFLTRGLRVMIHDQYEKFGSVFTISLFGQKVTFLVGPEVSAHFFQGPDSEISHGNMLEFTVPIIGKEVGYGVDSTTRKEQYSFFFDALKPPKLRSHIGPMLQEVENYFSNWGQQGLVDLKHEMEQLLMLISGRCLIGKEVHEMIFNEFFTLFHKLTENSFGLTSMFFPYAPTSANRRRDIARAELSKLLTEIIRLRKISNTDEKDLLQNLIDSKYRDGRPTTEVEVTAMIISIIFAGKHISSISSTWTGACLLHHKRWLAAATEEQELIIRKYGDHIDYSILQEMDILHRCVKEVLRLHPPSPMFFRKVHKSFNIRSKEGEEFEIPSGHTLVSPVLFNCSIPYIYKDPDVYDPDRFGPGREEDKVGGKFSYTPFSGGRHTCPGEAFAYMEMKVIWSHLLRNFELSLVSPFPRTNWMKIIPDLQGKVMVSYKRRSRTT